MEHSGDRASWSEKLQTRKHPVSPPPSPLTKPLRIPPLPLARASLSDKTLSCLSLSLSLSFFSDGTGLHQKRVWRLLHLLRFLFRMWGVQPNSTLSVVHILANSETIAASRAFACPGLDLVSTSHVSNLPIPFDRTGSEGEAIRGRVPAKPRCLGASACLRCEEF